MCCLEKIGSILVPQYLSISILVPCMLEITNLWREEIDHTVFCFRLISPEVNDQKCQNGYYERRSKVIFL